MRGLIAAALCLSACQQPPTVVTVDLGTAVWRQVALFVDGESEIVIDTAGEPLLVEFAVDGDDGIEVTDLRDGTWRPTPGWFRPQPVTGPLTMHLTGHGKTVVTFWSRGRTIGPVDPERAVVWHEPVPLDGSGSLSFGGLMARVDEHPGALLEAWFERFATTPWSRRTGPAELLTALRIEQGDDPEAWDLDALPFTITAVHNRTDLWGPEHTQVDHWRTLKDCGQVRVTATATPSESETLHLIFFFRQPALDDDFAPDGTKHCLGTARKWSRLSSGGPYEFNGHAWFFLGSALSPKQFIMAQSLEREDDVWEWRDWKLKRELGKPTVLDNSPLFQEVDIVAVNTPGALRDEFLAFVEDNAQGLEERTVLIPKQFRPRVVSRRELAPPPTLDLSGVDPAVLASHPRLAEQIQMVGCAGCHTALAGEFNQTYPDRSLSDFQVREVEARAQLLDDMNAGNEVTPPSLGPLQDY